MNGNGIGIFFFLFLNIFQVDHFIRCPKEEKKLNQQQLWLRTTLMKKRISLLVFFQCFVLFVNEKKEEGEINI